MKLSEAKIEDDKIILKFDYRMYGIGDDITFVNDLKLWTNPKQVCKDLINTAYSISNKLEFDLDQINKKQEKSITDKMCDDLIDLHYKTLKKLSDDKGE